MSSAFRSPPFLLLALVAMSLGVALVWFWRDGPAMWSPPQPVAPEIRVSEVAREASGRASAAQHAVIVERPLFSDTRRPFVPDPEGAQASVVATDLVLAGLFGSGETAGALVRIDGGVERVRIGEHAGGWILRQIRGSTAVFERAGQTREIRLEHATQAPVPARPRALAESNSPRSGANEPGLPVPGVPSGARQSNASADNKSARTPDRGPSKENAQ